MEKTCPKCFQTLDADTPCCADVEMRWVCEACGRKSAGFAFPFGRCPRCAGMLRRSKPPGTPVDPDVPEEIEAIQTALQFEISAATYYKMAAERAIDPRAQGLLRALADFEEDHRRILEQRYHVHWVASHRGADEQALRKILFGDLDTSDDLSEAADLFERAIRMERNTYHYFEEKAREMPEGPARRLYEELAEEEEEHLALLGAERSRLMSRIAGAE